MRLTLVTETFPPEVNGVARTLGRWVETFRARGHQVQVIRPRRRREASATGLVWSVPLPFYPEVRIGLATTILIHRWLRRHGSELVHIATEGTLGLSALQAARRLRIPIASSFHTNFDRYLGHYGFGLLEKLGTAYLRWFHNATTVTLVPSDSTRQRLREHGFRRVEIWSRGVDAELFHPQRRSIEHRLSLGLDDSDVLLLYAGRLAAEKNLPALLQAFARLRAEQGERVWLALVGGGPLEAELRSHCPPGVLLAGYQHGADLSCWYASADVFAFPSLSETFGNVILEAQASGLPVVAFDYEAIKERVRHDVDGLLVPTSGDLAEPLRQLCMDRERRQHFAVAARQSAEGQDWGPIFDDLEKRYHRLCD